MLAYVGFLDRDFSVAGNNLGGTIPSGLGGMASLMYVNSPHALSARADTHAIETLAYLHVTYVNQAVRFALTNRLHLLGRRVANFITP